MTRFHQGALVLLCLGALIAVFAFGPVVKWYRQRAADQAATIEQKTDQTEALQIEVEGAAEISAAAANINRAARRLSENAHALNATAAADTTAGDELPQSVRDRIAAGDEQLRASGLKPTDDGAATPDPASVASE